MDWVLKFIYPLWEVLVFHGFLFLYCNSKVHLFPKRLLFNGSSVAQLLPNSITRTTKIQLKGWQLLFEEYLLDQTFVYILNSCKKRQTYLDLYNSSEYTQSHTIIAKYLKEIMLHHYLFYRFKLIVTNIEIRGQFSATQPFYVYAKNMLDAQRTF